MKKQDFKKGQWVIRKWKDENGGEFDFAKFEQEDPQDRNEFYSSRYCRIKGKNVDKRFSRGDSTNYIDSRMEFDFRLATKAEIKKYTALAAWAVMYLIVLIIK